MVEETTKTEQKPNEAIAEKIVPDVAGQPATPKKTLGTKVPLAIIRRLASKVGIRRISQHALEETALIIEEFAGNLLSNALTITLSNKKLTISDREIRLSKRLSGSALV